MRCFMCADTPRWQTSLTLTVSDASHPGPGVYRRDESQSTWGPWIEMVISDGRPPASTTPVSDLTLELTSVLEQRYLHDRTGVWVAVLRFLETCAM